MGREPSTPSHGGFTLLEVIVAMLLLGIALLGLMALQIRSVRSNSFSNCMTVASCFARNQIETLRSQSADDWDSLSDGTFTDTVTDIDKDSGAARMVFTRQWKIETDPDDRMRDVSVTVSWRQDGHPHQIDVSTRIAKRE
jgi:type IV pilus modification protein PilV